MKVLPAVGAVLILAAGAFALQLAYHGYAEHDYVDVFHLVVGALAVAISIFLLWRSRRTQV